MTTPGYEIGRDGRGLTERERQVVALVAMGHSQVETAEILGLSKQRVKQLVDSSTKKGVTVTRGRDRVVITLPRPA